MWKAAWTCLLVSLLTGAIPKNAAAADRNIKFGLDFGYSSGQRQGDATAQGIGFGGFLSYGFNSRWAIGIEADRDWYFTTRTAARSDNAEQGDAGAAEVPQNSEVAGTETGSEVATARSRTTTAGVTAMALSAIYSIDVMRVLPFISLGVVGQLASLEKYGVGVRLGLGFDYMVTANVGFGAVFHGDLFFVGNSEYQGRLSVLLRATCYFGVGKHTAVGS